MSRAKWKIPFIDKTLLSKFILSVPKVRSKQTFKTQRYYIMSRASTVSKFFVNKQVFVHIGNRFQKISITKLHIGYKFGEFAYTRKYTRKLIVPSANKTPKKIKK